GEPLGDARELFAVGGHSILEGAQLGCAERGPACGLGVGEAVLGEGRLELGAPLGELGASLVEPVACGEQRLGLRAVRLEVLAALVDRLELPARLRERRGVLRELLLERAHARPMTLDLLRELTAPLGERSV